MLPPARKPCSPAPAAPGSLAAPSTRPAASCSATCARVAATSSASAMPSLRRSRWRAPTSHRRSRSTRPNPSSPATATSKTRDGTLLSINVRLPGPADQGPYPTVIEYSGYDPSNPDGRQPASSIAEFLGFATVGVNLRGTGCSGGAFDYFEELQSLDGYDAVEAIAAQPWVAHGKVGMVGISYPGITQLFVAAHAPTPPRRDHPALGVRRHLRRPLYPGGILNEGFAVRLGRGPPSRREAGDPRRRRSEVGGRAHRRRRHDLPRQPGAPPPGPRRHAPDPGLPLPARRGVGRARTGDLRARHQRARVPRRHLAGPGDGRSLRQHGRRLLVPHPAARSR